MSGQHRRLKQLHKKIPEFKCKEGCTDCCGIVPWAPIEWDKVQDKRTQTGCDCPYSKNGGCDIYNDRPYLCRIFGTAPGNPLLKCPHGCQPDIPLTEKEANKLTKIYNRDFMDGDIEKEKFNLPTFSKDLNSQTPHPEPE